MKRLILSILAILCPCLALFLLDDPIGGLIAFMLQASLIGWIPASMWAWRSIRNREQQAAKEAAETNDKNKPTIKE